MQPQLRDAPARVQTRVDMFSDVTICTNAGECRVVQIRNRWWLYDDGSYVLSIHRDDNPMQCSSFSGGDPGTLLLLEMRTSEMWRLADGA